MFLRSTFLFSLFVLSTSLVAQEYSNVRAVGMGRAGVAVSRGIDAMFVNPSGLGFADRSTFSINVPALNIGGDIGTGFTHTDDFNYFFEASGKSSLEKFYSDPARRSRFVRLLEGGRFDGIANLTLFAASYTSSTFGSIGLSYSHVIGSRLNIPPALGEFLRSADFFSGPIQICDPLFQAQWYSSLQLSYAYPVRPSQFVSHDALTESKAAAYLEKEQQHDLNYYLGGVSVGASLKLIDGYFYGGVDPEAQFYFVQLPNSNADMYAKYRLLTSFSPSVTLTDSSVKVETGFPKSAGSGLGIDLGVSAELFPKDNGTPLFIVGTSFMDIGSITWKENTAEREVNHRDTINPRPDDSLASRMSIFAPQPKTRGSFSTPLPTTFRFGVAYMPYTHKPFPAGDVTVAFDIMQGLDRSFATSQTTRFSLGAEWRPVVFSAVVPALRLGITSGGYEGFQVAAGAGLSFFNVVDLEAAASQLNGSPALPAMLRFGNDPNRDDERLKLSALIRVRANL